jgi:hypothetical protein
VADTPEALEEPYYCHKCQAQQAATEEPKGLFGPLLSDLAATNSAAFRLPGHVQTYFDGVIVQKSGEYVDITDRVPVYVSISFPRLWLLTPM